LKTQVQNILKQAQQEDESIPNNSNMLHTEEDLMLEDEDHL
jgi:hypothetical protein